MTASSLRSQTVRFGVFEFDPRAKELRKQGMRVKLRGQPVEMLQLLLERPGEVVTREELQKKLWPADTFVDFEHGVNAAMKRLRAALDEDPERPRFIETLPRVGYRFIGQLDGLSSAAPTTPPQQFPTDSFTRRAVSALVDAVMEARRAQTRWRVRAVVGLVSAVGLAALLAGVWLQWSRSPALPQPAGGRLMLAVLPFENLTGDPGQEYFSDGLTEEMISQLGRLDPQRLGVIARTSVMHYKHSPAQLDQIGRELGVQYALEGSVRRDAHSVRVSAQLIRVADQTHVWARQYDREPSNLLALQAEIARETADEIELALGEHPRIASAPPASLSPQTYEAYDLYLKGRYFWNKRTYQGFQQAADYFQQSIATDPNYARGYAGLADTFGLMSTWYLVPQNEFMPKARAAALRALEIDESLAEAHTSLALIVENYDYDWQTAEKEFRRAIQLDPAYATAHQWYAEYLSWHGRFDEALAESDRARQLDPLSLIVATDHGAILFFARQYDRAIAQLHGVLDIDPSFDRARGIMIYAYAQQGRFAEALREIEQPHLPPDDPWAWGMRAYIYGRSGRTAEAQHALAKFEQLMRRWPSAVTQALLLTYLATDRKDQAIALLQKASSEHSNAVVGLKVDPNFDPLRSDPRFQELLRRVGLPP